MACIAWINWHGISQIFETPEDAKYYNWLKDVNQEPKLNTFNQSQLPKGELLRTQQLYSITQSMSEKPEELTAINSYFKHHYLTSYQTLNSVNYIAGDYKIISINKLTTSDFVTQGTAIELQAIELIHDELSSNWINYPLQLKLLLPHTNPKKLQLKTNDQLKLNVNNAISIIDISLSQQQSANKETITTFEPKITVIPLGKHLKLTGQTKPITIHAPKEWNVQAQTTNTENIFSL